MRFNYLSLRNFLVYFCTSNCIAIIGCCLSSGLPLQEIEHYLYSTASVTHHLSQVALGLWPRWFLGSAVQQNKKKRTPYMQNHEPYIAMQVISGKLHCITHRYMYFYMLSAGNVLKSALNQANLDNIKITITIIPV